MHAKAPPPSLFLQSLYSNPGKPLAGSTGLGSPSHGRGLTAMGCGLRIVLLVLFLVQIHSPVSGVDWDELPGEFQSKKIFNPQLPDLELPLRGYLIAALPINRASIDEADEREAMLEEIKRLRTIRSNPLFDGIRIILLLSPEFESKLPAFLKTTRFQFKIILSDT